MQIRSSKNSCMGNENRLYSISLGVASLQGGLVGVATALSPATCRPFQVFSPSFFVGLELSPYVNFQGQARDAMEFYRAALCGNLDLQSMNEQGQFQPAGPQDRVTYARLEAEGAVIIASDGHPDYPAKVGNNMAIVLGGTDKVRLTRIFNTLAEGGRIQMPLTKQPWGADVGWLADKFGIIWTITMDTA